MAGEIKEYCVCGFTLDSHNGVLTLEKLKAAVELLKDMEPTAGNIIKFYRPIRMQCCDNYRRDNLRYLEEIADA